MGLNVVILGASDKPERYSYKALKKFLSCGHTPYLVHPSLKEIEGKTCYASLDELKENHPHTNFDLLTVYVNPSISGKMVKSILNFRFKRVIFNPGTENYQLSDALEKNGTRVEDACTLVLLHTCQL